MNYSMYLNWNGKNVLEAKGTAAACFDAALGFMRGNFAGKAHAEYCEGQSKRLGELLGGYNTLSMAWGDETGTAHACIARIEG